MEVFISDLFLCLDINAAWEVNCKKKKNTPGPFGQRTQMDLMSNSIPAPKAINKSEEERGRRQEGGKKE